MVQGFASGAGGRVEVGSTPGRTCFRIVLPRADLDA
jgi:nitrogen-specific signal transduction histidine kinase